MILKFQNPAYGRGDAYRCGGPMNGFGDFVTDLFGGVASLFKGAADFVTAPSRAQTEQLEAQKAILQVQADSQAEAARQAAAITEERAKSVRTIALVGGGTIALIALAAAIRSQK